MSSARRPGLAPPLARRLLAALAATLVLLVLPTGAAASCTATDAMLGAEGPTGLTNATGCVHAAFATAGPLQVDPGVAAQLDGSASVGDDGVAHGGAGLTFAWHFGDELDPQATTSPDPSPTTSHLYSTRGHYVAWFTVTDASVNPAVTSQPSDPLDVYVSELPVAAFTPPVGTLRPGHQYQFDAGASTAPGGSIDHCEWDWGDGSPIESTSAGVCSAQHTFAAEDSSSAVTLTVVNDVGLRSAPVTHAIAVHDARPLVQLAATPSTVSLGQQLTLSAAGSSDPDGTIVEYRWDLDANGSFETSTGMTASATAGPYPNAGVITLRVKALDDSGGSTVASVDVTVADPDGSGAGGAGDAGSGTGGSGAGGAGGSGGTHGSGGGSGGAAGQRFALGLSGTAIQRIGAVLRRGVALRARANRTARGTLTLTISARDARTLRLVGRHGRSPATIGTLRIRLRSGHPSKPAVKLTRRAARALRRAHLRRLRVTVRGVVASATGRASAVRVVLLRG